MNINFERVLSDDNVRISKVFKILKNCGEYMFRNQGLIHWRNPYPIDSIIENCKVREVYLIKDLDTDQYVHTFQLEFTSEPTNNPKMQVKKASIFKFATDPQFTGKGIGKHSMAFIEWICRNKSITKICLEVYEKSEHAIKFYINCGFKIVGLKPTKYFKVYIMEKELQ